MTIIYEPYQSTLENKDGKRLFHPRTIRVGNVNTAQISREIAAYSSLSAGDVKNTLDNLVTVMTQHLQASESVTIDGLGTIRITMQSQGMGVETAEEVSAAQATLMVRFLPASTRNPDGKTATRSLLTGAKCKRFDRANDPTSPEEPVEPGGEEEGGGGL